MIFNLYILKLLIILYVFDNIFGFKNNLISIRNIYNRKRVLHCMGNNNNKKYNEMIDEFESRINNFMINNIEFLPTSEEDIKEESFEAYLRTHFKIIKNTDDTLPFERFIKWRKHIGTVLTKDELQIIYEIVNKSLDNCNLLTFILLNQIIDENDGARF